MAEGLSMVEFVISDMAKSAVGLGKSVSVEVSKDPGDLGISRLRECDRNDRCEANIRSMKWQL